MKLISRKPLPNIELTLRQFHERRNKVLIVREVGGLGDILMHRMMFEDLKKVHPEIKIIFACPQQYHTALKDHPYIDELADSKKISTYDYIVSYNTTTACTRYEVRVSPFSGEHRSDIWAGHCGVTLTNHNMHISIPEEKKQIGRDMINDVKKDFNGPVVIISPISAMIGKNLTDDQLVGLISNLRSRNCFVCATHFAPIPLLKKMKVPVFHGISTLNWMGVINAADYIISVDTATFHFAGGIGKPLLGIFTFADGKVYSKYYQSELIQKHRDNGDWDCGPCYNWANCPKVKTLIKPCLTEITNDMLIDGVDRMFKRWPFHTLKRVQLVMER